VLSAPAGGCPPADRLATALNRLSLLNQRSTAPKTAKVEYIRRPQHILAYQSPDASGRVEAAANSAMNPHARRRSPSPAPTGGSHRSHGHDREPNR